MHLIALHVRQFCTRAGISAEGVKVTIEFPDAQIAQKADAFAKRNNSIVNGVLSARGRVGEASQKINGLTFEVRYRGSNLPEE